MQVNSLKNRQRFAWLACSVDPLKLVNTESYEEFSVFTEADLLDREEEVFSH